MASVLSHGQRVCSQPATDRNPPEGQLVKLSLIHSFQSSLCRHVFSGAVQVRSVRHGLVALFEQKQDNHRENNAVSVFLLTLILVQVQSTDCKLKFHLLIVVHHRCNHNGEVTKVRTVHLI